jgi:hypothetical protein
MNTAHDFQRAFNLDLGFDPADVLALEVDFGELDFGGLAFNELAFDFATLLALESGVFFELVAAALGFSL